MYHPSIWHPIDMAAAFRSLRQTTSSPNISPEKSSVSGFNAAFSVNTLLNQSSSETLRIPSITTATAHQHNLFSSLFQHYPYAAAFRPLFNGTTNSPSESSAFLPAGKRFKNNSHDENHCETTSSSDESFGKSTDHRCRSSTIDLQNPQCPICQVSLNGQDMITHVQHELDLIERRQQYKAKRGNKVLQDNNNNIDQTFKTRYETFLRVRTSRQQRLNAKLQMHNRRLIRNDTRNCPICYQSIPITSDEEFFFNHVQQCSRKREQLAAVTAIANHHRLSSPLPPTIDDPDVNVVDIDDGIEREEKSTSGTTTSLSCQESFNSDQRYSPSTQTDILYTKSPNTSELDPPKCVVCME
ncbi:unnamed protein product [Adineta steineri]|uniref:E3 ubiquitin-protein ligase RNF220 middle domain-containing protein n=1 Tax=Adineta steineri TaxID=433720 RepID=A0A814TW22_9BILA|nr:unnamed protein product [Adineta steineri]CAF0889515.1 unnamed protein product [Adineta steineri]CAF1165365.1 unnamed protein product [Adineta steineri]CAF3922041.1 unnamed protein product [Adineta steineri]